MARRNRRRPQVAERRSSPRPADLGRIARWRAQLDSFGGPLVVGGLGGAVVLLVVVVVLNPPFSVSEDPLLGESVTLGPASHVTDSTQLQITAGQPPAGGPMFPSIVRQGIYDEPVSDGSVVHSLEHGLVWISYNPDLVDDETVDGLEAVADDFGRDVILSPRLGNETLIAVTSWGQILTLDTIEEEQLRAFVSTNRNRSPEAGIR
jgi:Protein of unknown function (DUF3105)